MKIILFILLLSFSTFAQAVPPPADEKEQEMLSKVNNSECMEKKIKEAGYKNFNEFYLDMEKYGKAFNECAKEMGYYK